MDATAARQCALDGVEVAKLWIRQDADWRTNRPAGVWATDLATGGGTVTIEVVDPVDGNLAKGQHDALFVKCTGKKSSAKHIVSVTLAANPIPLDCLAYVAHTAGEVSVFLNKTLNAAGGIVSTNGRLTNNGTITGGVDVGEANPLGAVTGTPVNTNQPAKALPSISIVDKYEALGTLITVPNSIQDKTLAPGYNPFTGGTNADGIYVIRPAGNLSIRTCRIHGTLVVILNANMKLYVDDRVLFHPSRSDQPTLIVKGNAEFTFYGTGEVLSELAPLRNFNPPGAPYNGLSNVTMTETYPSEIQGLVHVTGKLIMRQTSRIRGALLVNSADSDAIQIFDTPELIYTSSLFSNPPQWYTKEVRMPIQAGSWSQPAN
jgi:hypothetical protein